MSALDRELWVTQFRDVAATTKQSRFASLRALRPQLLDTTAPAKEALPLLKLASFGERRTKERSLRHNGNVHEVYGLEGDYDGEKLSPEQLADALRSHNLAGLVVTSPSHRDAAPRARLLLPFSTPLPPAERERMLDRLAGIIPAPHTLAPESWVVSQGYYFGRVGMAPQHRVLEVDGDFIDLRPDLDATARPKPAGKLRKPAAKPNGAGEQPELTLNIADALAALGDDAPGIHDALVALAGRFAAEGLSRSTAEAIIAHAFNRRPQAERDARWHARRGEVMRTVTWAYEHEAAMPVPALLPPPPPPPIGTNGAGGIPDDDDDSGQPAPAPQDDSDIDASVPPPYSDEQLALAFAEQHIGRLRYVAAWAQWHAWDGACWREDDTLRVFSRARLLLRQAAASCRKRRLAPVIASARTVAAVERLARSDQRLAATVRQWDADPWLLNTPAGMVDLHTGRIWAHRIEAYASKITAAVPGGDCPTWRGFLDTITGQDQALQHFLQRVAGYCLTGLTTEHALFFGYGTGGNGKGTFINTLAGVMGSYAATAAMETFTAAPTDQHTCDLAMLRGARLVTAQETADGRRWNESRIKAMTGGDPITARFMRQNFFTYMPAFKLFIAGNHRPGLRSVNEAIRRRLHLVPFDVTIPPAERDRDLAHTLEAEWPGILAWAIAGCLGWQHGGLAPPAAVTAATDEYLAGEDLVQSWIEEQCAIVKGRASYSATLYSSFRAWAELAGEFVPTQRWFVAALADRGYRQEHDRRQGRHQRTVIGLVLKSSAGTVPP